MTDRLKQEQTPIPEPQAKQATCYTSHNNDNNNCMVLWMGNASNQPSGQTLTRSVNNNNTNNVQHFVAVACPQKCVSFVMWSSLLVNDHHRRRWWQIITTIKNLIATNVASTFAFNWNWSVFFLLGFGFLWFKYQEDIEDGARGRPGNFVFQNKQTRRFSK